MALKRGRQRLYLREWRKHLDLSQEVLADRIGVNRSWISDIETGKKQYTQEFLEAAADALGIEPADLLVRNPLDPRGYWTIWDSIPPQERPQYAAAIEAMRTAMKKAG